MLKNAGCTNFNRLKIKTLNHFKKSLFFCSFLLFSADGWSESLHLQRSFTRLVDNDIINNMTTGFRKCKKKKRIKNSCKRDKCNSQCCIKISSGPTGPMGATGQIGPTGASGGISGGFIIPYSSGGSGQTVAIDEDGNPSLLFFTSFGQAGGNPAGADINQIVNVTSDFGFATTRPIRLKALNAQITVEAPSDLTGRRFNLKAQLYSSPLSQIPAAALTYFAIEDAIINFPPITLSGNLFPLTLSGFVELDTPINMGIKLLLVVYANGDDGATPESIRVRITSGLEIE